MDHVTAVPEAITAFGDVQAAVSSQYVTGGAVNIAMVSAAMTPAFGLLGLEHQVATVVAMMTNTFEVAQLAAVHAGHAAASFGSAANYVAAEGDNALELSNVAKLI